MKKNFLLLFIILIVTLCSLEIFLKFLYPQNLIGWYAYRDNSGLNILRKNSNYYHRAFGRTAKYTFGEFNNRVTSNNNSRDKLLILGDSFTFGWLINDQYIFSEILQRHLKNYKIINPSVPGWGIADYTRYLETYCKDISPKNVIIMFNTDDLRRGYISKLYKMDILNLIKIKNKDHPEIDRIFDLEYIEVMDTFKVNQGTVKPLVTYSKYHEIPFYKFLVKNSHLFYLLRQTIVNLKDKKIWSKKTLPPSDFDIPTDSIPTQLDVAEISGKILLLRLKEISKKCNTKLNIVYSGWYDYENLPLLDNPTLHFLKYSKNFFKKHKINFFDLSFRMKEMHKNPTSYIITYDNHPNELGHKIIGENLIYLFENNFIK